MLASDARKMTDEIISKRDNLNADKLIETVLAKIKKQALGGYDFLDSPFGQMDSDGARKIVRKRLTELGYSCTGDGRDGEQISW